MKPQYQHDLMTSFMLFIDHHLLDKGEAYSNKTGKLYYFDDSRLPDSYTVFASPYKQWVNDSSVAGDTNPIIPTTISGDSTSGRSDGFIFDFENGRIIHTGEGTVNTGQAFSGTFAVKDFNVYLTEETEEDLILESNFKINSRYGESQSGIKPYDRVVPAVFISAEEMSNQGFAFGGEDITTNQIKAVVFAENSYQLDGILSIFADTRHKSFQKIPFTGHPSTEYGDVKGGSYNFDNLSTEFSTLSPYTIQEVTTSKFSDKGQQALPGNVKVGFIDFDVIATRFPRA